MGWTYSEIESGWLGGSTVAVSPEDVVSAFDQCERILGREWLNGLRGDLSGAGPSLQVVAAGRQLRLLDGLTGTEELIDKLKKKNASAYAELTAIYLLANDRETEVELYPKAAVGKRERVPDFRVKRDGPWVHVEVTRPGVSEVAERAQAIATTLAEVVRKITKPIALEVFLRREPTEAEIDILRANIFTFSENEETRREELPVGLGLLIRSEYPPGVLVPTDHSGEEVCPRFGAAQGVVGTDGQARHVMVRIPFSDQRAERFISSEAAQLPRVTPGLIMVDMTKTRTGFKSWEPLLKRRFQLPFILV